MDTRDGWDQVVRRPLSSAHLHWTAFLHLTFAPIQTQLSARKDVEPPPRCLPGWCFPFSFLCPPALLRTRELTCLLSPPGTVLVTIGTGRLSPAEVSQTGLISRHDYAVQGQSLPMYLVSRLTCGSLILCLGRRRTVRGRRWLSVSSNPQSMAES